MDNGKATIIASIIAAVATIIAAIIGVTMQKENSVLQAENNESQGEIAELRNKNEQLEETISTLQTANDKSEDGNSALRVQIETLQDINSDLQAQLSTLQKENSNLNQMLSSLSDENDTMKERISELTARILILEGNTSPKSSEGYNFLSVCTPYQSQYYNAPTTESIAGNKYSGIFFIEKHGSRLGYAYYNLDGQYKSLSFDIGHRDGMEMETGTYNFYLDGNLEHSIDLTPEMMPKHYSLDLHYAKQMKIEGAENWPESYAFFNVRIS